VHSICLLSWYSGEDLCFYCFWRQTFHITNSFFQKFLTEKKRFKRMSLVGAGMGSNPIRSHFCWYIPSWWKFMMFCLLFSFFPQNILFLMFLKIWAQTVLRCAKAWITTKRLTVWFPRLFTLLHGYYFAFH